MAEATERTGVSVDELRRLLESGILSMDAAHRSPANTIRRVPIVRSLVAAGMPLDLLAGAVHSAIFRSISWTTPPTAASRFTRTRPSRS